MNKVAKPLIAMCAVVIGGGLVSGVFERADAAAPPPIDVTNHRVACDSLVGKLKFSTPLVIGGSSANSITVGATISGCVDLDDSNVKLKPTKMKGVLSTPTNDCLSLIGPTSVSGTVQIKWKTLPGTPKLTDGDPGVAGAVSDMSISQASGGTFAAPSSWGNGGTSGYGLFQIGADPAHGNTAPPSVANAFTGGNGGITSTFDGTTGESAAAILAQCLSPSGVKALNFGIGALYLA